MPRIDCLYAFIAADGDHQGGEGLVGRFDPLTRTWTALVGADLARVEALRPIAQDIATTTGKGLTLAFFKDRHDIERIDP